MNPAASFCDLFCKAFECAPEEFDQRAFWLCLYPHAVLPARFIWILNRGYFKQDLELTGLVKHLTSSDEVVLEVERFRSYYRTTGLLRGLLRVRISGRRVLKLAGRLFAEALEK
jgi:hypothetical protein